MRMYQKTADQTDTDLNVTHVDYTWLIVKDSVIAIQPSFDAIYSDYFLLHVISEQRIQSDYGHMYLAGSKVVKDIIEIMRKQPGKACFTKRAERRPLYHRSVFYIVALIFSEVESRAIFMYFKMKTMTLCVQ